MSKKMYGFLSFIPMTLVVLSLLIIGCGAGQTYLGEQELMGVIATAIGIGFIAVIMTYVVMILLIVKACKNPYFTDSRKISWGIVLYMLNIFVYPYFWYKYIYKEWDEEREAKEPDVSVFWIAMPNILALAVGYLVLLYAFLPTSVFKDEILLVFVAVILLILLAFVFIAVIRFGIHVCKRADLHTGKKIAWVLGFVFASILATTLYWGMYVYKRGNLQTEL